ncbi:hypothetical protein HYQ46_006858 [Verticillium longisporum]|nr:hypothetical protein HYQ46_006858 [Verticillium longisporum]
MTKNWPSESSTSPPVTIWADGYCSCMRREPEPFVDYLEVLGDKFVTFGNRLVNLGDRAFRSCKLRKVENVGLVLNPQLLVCSECTAPGLAVLKVLDHVEVYSLLALKL